MFVFDLVSRPAWPALVLAASITGQAAATQPMAVSSKLLPTNDETTGYPAVNFKTAVTYPVIRVVGRGSVVVLIDHHETTVHMAGLDHSDNDLLPPDLSDDDAMQANLFANRLLRGESVYLEDHGLHNGQRVVHLFRAPDGLFVNAEILRQGFGKIDRRYDGRYAKLFHFCERKARKAAKGLWDPWDAAFSDELHAVQPARPSLAANTQPIVYVTSSGAKYHTLRCAHLDPDPIAMPVYKALTGFQWCDRCKPPK